MKPITELAGAATGAADEARTRASSAADAALAAPRAAYSPPALHHLGPWSALTLQQSVPIFP